MASRFFDYDERLDGSGDAALLPRWTDADWDVLVGFAERLRFPAGSSVAGAGNVDTSLFVVVGGTVEVRITPDRTVTLRAGALIGEVAFFDGLGRSADVVAATDTDVLRISASGFEQFAARHPGLAIEMLRDLGRILALRLRAAEALAREGR
jgi:CRP-like cAMP-binding protein